MKEYLALRLVSLTEHLVNAQLVLWEYPKAFPDPRKNIQYHAKEVFQEAEFLSLPSTKKQAMRLYQYAENQKETHENIDRAAEELHTRLRDELDSLKLFYVPQDKLKFYNKTDFFGQEFKNNFPNANAEISEAANCFAFDRFTGCAFHLMRSLEIVLKTIFTALKLPPLTKVGAKNWSGILREIKDKLDTDRTISDHAFYEDAYAFLAAAKNPMRNATMHVDVSYDEQSVRRLFDAVGAFMRQIATKLKESP
jgi:hypothetical protein